MIQLIPKVEEKLNNTQMDEIYQFVKLNKKVKIEEK